MQALFCAPKLLLMSEARRINSLLHLDRALAASRGCSALPDASIQFGFPRAVPSTTLSMKLMRCSLPRHAPLLLNPRSILRFNVAINASEQKTTLVRPDFAEYRALKSTYVPNCSRYVSLGHDCDLLCTPVALTHWPRKRRLNRVAGERPSWRSRCTRNEVGCTPCCCSTASAVRQPSW